MRSKRRITKQPTSRDGRFRPINENLQEVVTAMARQLVPLGKKPVKRCSDYRDLEGPCLRPPFASEFGYIAKARNEKEMPHWLLKRKEFGVTRKGNPKERMAYELFFILANNLPWNEKPAIWRLCSQAGCCNPRHYELHVALDDPLKLCILEQLNKLDKEKQKCQ